MDEPLSTPSNQPAGSETGDWQRTCEVCGTELEQVQLEFTEADFSDGREGTPVLADVCPNPDCSRHQHEYGAAAGG